MGKASVLVFCDPDKGNLGGTSLMGQNRLFHAFSFFSSKYEKAYDPVALELDTDSTASSKSSLVEELKEL